jgi:streptomycin 6-kinase
MIAARDELERYRERWRLEPDGEPFRTHSSWLQPVRHRDTPAMLKVAFEDEERRGATLMAWWRGDGAARVLERDRNALVLERAAGAESLVEMARRGRDDEASRVLCTVAGRLHAPRGEPCADLVPLVRWFRELEPAAARHGGVLARAAAAARELLREPRDVSVLHGDIHHGNVLDFGARGWLAIDPKGLVGERGFDFANVFCNPDLETAVAPGRLARQASVVADAAGLDRTRLLSWILAYAGLSAAWTLEEGDRPALALAVAEIAAAELAGS